MLQVFISISFLAMILPGLGLSVDESKKNCAPEFHISLDQIKGGPEDLELRFESYLVEIDAAGVVNHPKFKAVKPGRANKRLREKILNGGGREALIEFYYLKSGLGGLETASKLPIHRSLSLRVYLSLMLQSRTVDLDQSQDILQNLTNTHYQNLRDPALVGPERILAIEFLGRQAHLPWITGEIRSILAVQIHHEDSWVQHATLSIAHKIFDREYKPSLDFMQGLEHSIASLNSVTSKAATEALSDLSIQYEVLPESMINTLVLCLGHEALLPRSGAATAISKILGHFQSPRVHKLFSEQLSEYLGNPTLIAIEDFRMLTIASHLKAPSFFLSTATQLALDRVLLAPKKLRAPALDFFVRQRGQLEVSFPTTLDGFEGLVQVVDDNLQLRKKDTYRRAALAGLLSLRNTDQLSMETLERLSRPEWLGGAAQTRALVVDLFLGLDSTRQLSEEISRNLKTQSTATEKIALARDAGTIVDHFLLRP